MITVFGSINLDLIAGVERLPRPGETVPGGTFTTAPGGKGANQALAARRAGAPVRMAGAVGEDSFAAEALRLLRDGGVDLREVATVAGPTGVALIMVEGTGENVIVVVPGANGAVDAAAAERLDFSAGDVLLLQLEVPVPSIAVAARRARDAGARVILNFAPVRNEAIELIGSATHLVVNETECALVAKALGVGGGSLEGQALALGAKTGATVVLTMGADGVLAVEAGQVLKAAAIPVTPIDTVAAGDTFCGYLATALAEGQALGPALTLAAAAGSLACTRSGAQPSIPERADVEGATGAR